MPTTYAHDLFGRAVMHHLSGQTAQVVKEYPLLTGQAFRDRIFCFIMLPFRKK